MEKKCSGKRKTWPWKGYPCGAVPKYFQDGKWWCKNHLPIKTKKESKNEVDSENKMLDTV